MIYLILKRLLDLGISLFSIIILSPLLVPIIIALLFTGEHEVFYRQKRIGKERKYFNILKFATMLKNSPNMGTGSITLRNDPRVTKLGKYLRITKINELPQIFNVIIGNMSIVGPRPLVDATFDAYPDEMKDHIYKSKPGITGIGSIVFRDEEELISNTEKEPHLFYRETIAPFKGALEMWYLENRSFWTDIKLIIYTAWVIVFPKTKAINSWFKGLPERNF